MTKSQTSCPVAVVRRLRLQPVAGRGARIQPPVYAPPRGKQGPIERWEDRVIDGSEIKAVLLDSVQSQANRLSRALAEACPWLSRVTLDLGGHRTMDGRTNLCSMSVPHGPFDSSLYYTKTENGKGYSDTDEYKAMASSSYDNATGLLRTAPWALLSGCWNSYEAARKKKKKGAKGYAVRISRMIASDVYGVNASTSTIGATRIDPFKASATAEETSAIAEEKKLSVVGMGSIIESIDKRGAVVDYAEQTLAIHLGRIFGIGFGDFDPGPGHDFLYNMAVAAVVAMDASPKGHDYRSGCVLAPDWEHPAVSDVVASTGERTPFEWPSLGDALTDLKAAAERVEQVYGPFRPMTVYPDRRLMKHIEEGGL